MMDKVDFSRQEVGRTCRRLRYRVLVVPMLEHCARSRLRQGDFALNRDWLFFLAFEYSALQQTPSLLAS